jgi:hypothetical protein
MPIDFFLKEGTLGMAKYVQWITHKGKRMLFVNVAGLPEAEYIVALEELKQALLKERTVALVLVDLSKTEMTTATVNKAKEVTTATKAAGIPFGPNAVVGMTKLQKSVADLSARMLHFADSIEEGKDWLAKQEDKHP